MSLRPGINVGTRGQSPMTTRMTHVRDIMSTLPPAAPPHLLPQSYYPYHTTVVVVGVVVVVHFPFSHPLVASDNPITQLTAKQLLIIKSWPDSAATTINQSQGRRCAKPVIVYLFIDNNMPFFCRGAQNVAPGLGGLLSSILLLA